MRTAVRWICMAACASAVCVLSGCQAKEQDAVTRIKENNVLTVAVTQEDGTGERQEAALLEEKAAKFLAKELGVELKLLKLSYEELKTAVEDKKADVAAGLVVDNEQMETYYSVVYGLKGSYLAEVRMEAEEKAAETAENIPVSISPELSSAVKSYVYSGAVNGVEEVESTKEAVEKLISGKTGGYVCYEKEARELLKDGRFLVKDLRGAPRECYVFVTDRDGYKLLNLINRFLTDELMN